MNTTSDFGTQTTAFCAPYTTMHSPYATSTISWYADIGTICPTPIDHATVTATRPHTPTATQPHPHKLLSPALSTEVFLPLAASLEHCGTARVESIALFCGGDGGDTLVHARAAPGEDIGHNVLTADAMELSVVQCIMVDELICTHEDAEQECTDARLQI